MKLLRNYMKTCLKTAAKNDMKIRVIGDINRWMRYQEPIRESKRATANNGGLIYNCPELWKPWDEITRAARKLAEGL